MNNITSLKSAALSAGSSLTPGTVQTKPLKNALPVAAVNNENASPNIGRRASHSEFSEKVMLEVQGITQRCLKLAIEAVLNGGNCQATVDKYCIKNKDSLRKIHTASLMAGHDGSAGAMLKKGEKWQSVAKKHGIHDERLLMTIKSFSACMDKKQAILKDVPADDEKYEGSTLDEEAVAPGAAEDKASGKKPGNYRITSLDAVLAHDAIISLAHL